jgi:predicted chitinase
MSEITSALLAQIAPGTPKAKRDRFIPFYNECLPRYGITTELRVAAFLTTVCFESDYFKALAEYADGWAYDISRNRKKALELGNTEVGDGPKYKGAGGIETTGKNNYRRLSKRLGIDFVTHPEKLRTVEYFVEAACVFWDDNKFNKLADKGKIVAIQNLTNRGDADKPAKALKSRVQIYQHILHVLPDDFNLISAAGPEAEPAQAVTEKVGGDTLTDDSPHSTAQPPIPEKPSIWSRVTARFDGWGEKADKIEGYTSRLPMSISSKMNVLGMKAFGLVMTVWGVLSAHPIYAALGTALIIAGAWYLSRSKDRNAGATQTQTQSVVVKQ